MKTELDGIPLVISRTGWSGEYCYEIYLCDSQFGEKLWESIMAAGKPYNIRAIAPNTIRSIEGGLLSYGNDMTDDNTPHECGLGRFCDTQTAIGCIGRDALLRVAKEGPVQQIRALAIEGGPVPPCDRAWGLYAGDIRVGQKQ